MVAAVAKTGVSILEKVAPKAVATLGKAGLIEVAAVAGVVAEGLNLVMTPIVDKGSEFVKSKVEAAAAGKKQELMEKRAALLEAKAQKAKSETKAAEVEETPETVESVEEKPKTSKKKNK